MAPVGAVADAMFQTSVLRGVVCCSVLQCVTVCCSVLQCDAVRFSALQCVAACCRVLQCVAVVGLMCVELTFENISQVNLRVRQQTFRDVRLVHIYYVP